MKIAVFGGTQGVGKQVVIQALEAGHTVTALARSPEKLSDVAVGKDNLTVIKGDILQDREAVEHVIDGQDAVIVSLGSTGPREGLQVQVCSNGQKTINEVMAAKSVKRLLVVTSIGVGDSMQDLSYLVYFFVNYVIHKAIADKNIQEDLVKNSGLDWTILRPGGLSNKEASGGKYKFAEHIYGDAISRADVAELCLELLDKEHVGKTYSCVGA